MKNKKIIQLIIIIVSLVLIIAGSVLLIKDKNLLNKNIQVTFKTEANDILYKKEIKSGEKIANFVPEVEKGYYFVGWFLEDKLYDFNNPITKNIELIAKFQQLANTDENEEQPENQTPSDEVIKETDIEYSISTTTMTVGETATVQASLVPENATVNDIRIYCEDIVVCSVDEGGVVTANRSGTTNIIIETFHGLRKEIAITVKPSYEVQILDKRLRIRSSEWKYVAGKITVNYFKDSQTYTIDVPKEGINIEREIEKIISIIVE